MSAVAPLVMTHSRLQITSLTMRGADNWLVFPSEGASFQMVWELHVLLHESGRRLLPSCGQQVTKPKQFKTSEILQRGVPDIISLPFHPLLMALSSLGASYNSTVRLTHNAHILLLSRADFRHIP